MEDCNSVASKSPLLIQPFVSEGQSNTEDVKQEIKDVVKDIVDFLPEVSLPESIPLDISAYVDNRADAVLPLLRGSKLFSGGSLKIELLAYINKPVILWSPKGYHGSWSKDIASFLTLRRAEVYQFVVPSEALETLKALRTRVRMKKSKILYFSEMAGISGLSFGK